MGLDPLDHGALGEGRAANEQIVKRAAEGIDVRPGVGGMAVLRLFRGKVVGGPQHLFVVGLGQSPLLVFVTAKCEAEIEDLDRAFVVEDEVGRLDVTVNKAFVVGVLQTEGCLANEINRLANR